MRPSNKGPMRHATKEELEIFNELMDGPGFEWPYGPRHEPETRSVRRQETKIRMTFRRTIWPAKERARRSGQDG